MGRKKLRCKDCGHVMFNGEDDLVYATYYEDYGDVSTLSCPNCGSILYDGMDFDMLFEDVTGKEL